MIDIDGVKASAMRISFPGPVDRTWLRGRLNELISASGWADLGGLLVAVAAKQAPFSLSKLLTDLAGSAPLIVNPDWSSAAWVRQEMEAHRDLICATDSDLYQTCCRAMALLSNVVAS